MKDTKFSRFIFEAGKLFLGIVIIIIPIIYADAFALRWHIALKIALWIALTIDYFFVSCIIDKACDTVDKANKNNKYRLKDKEQYHQTTINEYVEEKKED